MAARISALLATVGWRFENGSNDGDFVHGTCDSHAVVRGEFSVRAVEDGDSAKGSQPND
jgi:hypothetical protein